MRCSGSPGEAIEVPRDAEIGSKVPFCDVRLLVDTRDTDSPALRVPTKCAERLGSEDDRGELGRRCEFLVASRGLCPN